jgi:hypothetical protein
MSPPYIESVDATHVTLRWTEKHDAIRMSWAELRRAARGGVRGIALHFSDLLIQAECLREAAATIPPTRLSVRFGVRHQVGYTNA